MKQLVGVQRKFGQFTNDKNQVIDYDSVLLHIIHSETNEIQEYKGCTTASYGCVPYLRGKNHEPLKIKFADLGSVCGCSFDDLLKMIGKQIDISYVDRNGYLVVNTITFTD